MRNIDDDNVVKYRYRFLNQKSQKLFIVMEYCKGGDLKQLIDKHKKSGEPIREQIIWQVLVEMA
jgi:serine/threonine protein kinase